MGRPLALALGFGLVLSLGVSLAAMAHGPGEAEIVVEPAAITAGESVILAGTGLEPNSDRVLILAGQDLLVEFDTVTTDADGMFQIELTIPSHLPSGTYELRAIGDETLTTPLEVTAAAGGGGGSPVPNDPNETVAPRDRTPIELGVILVLVVLAAVAGGLLVWRAEWFRGQPGA